MSMKVSDMDNSWYKKKMEKCDTEAITTVCIIKAPLKRYCYYYNPENPYNTVCVAEEIRKMSKVLNIPEGTIDIRVDKETNTKTIEDELYIDPILLVYMPNCSGFIYPKTWLVAYTGGVSKQSYFKKFTDEEFKAKFEVLNV